MFDALLNPAAFALATVSLWYAVPLIVSVSLVCSATRHELIRPILTHAVRFAIWVLAFMGLFMALLTMWEKMA